MLVATRDPVHPHAPDASAHSHSRVGRWVSILQLAGSLLAIPVGLASGYSIYRANFSPETTCATCTCCGSKPPSGISTESGFGPLAVAKGCSEPELALLVGRKGAPEA